LVQKVAVAVKGYAYMKIVRCRKLGEQVLAYGCLQGDIIHPIIRGPFEDEMEYDELTKMPFNEAILGVPCEPTKVIAVAINYKGATGQTPNMSEPLVFIKGNNSVAAFNEKVTLPFRSNTWGEAELGVVIRKRGKKIGHHAVLDHILGYISANDVSCDNVDNRDHHLARSKSADGFCPIGYYIDTDYEFRNKSIVGYHNDLLLRKGNTSEMIWDPEKIVIWLSSWMTLYPGDVILTGTPSRVRERLFLKGGDTYTVEIEDFPKLITRFYDKW